MANPGHNEGFHVLDDFVCEAIHAPSVPLANPANQGRNEGMSVIEEVVFEASSENKPGKKESGRQVASWLKMIGTSGSPWTGPYTRNHVDFARKPRHIHSGDRLVLYAVGGSKRVFALAEVTSEVYDNGQERWPYRMDISFVVNLHVSSGVSIEEVSTPERDLLRSIRQASYIEMRPEEYERAATKLREASSKE